MASLVQQIAAAFTALATRAKADRTMINGNTADLSGLSTAAKTNLVLAINEVFAKAAAGVAIDDTAASLTKTYSSTKIAASIAALIDDTTASALKVYSSNKTVALVNAAVAGLVAASPGALDTLKELADAIADDPNFAATMNAALANRVRFDAAQTLTAAQSLQARSNISVYSQAEIGDPTTDFVAVVNAALV